MRITPALVLLAACGNDHAVSTTAPDAAPPAAAPTYWQDVEPIFATNCASCHTAGGIAPFAIDDADTAMTYAPLIATDTANLTMPPWPPGPLTPQLLHQRSLTQPQIDTIAAWAAAGAPLGDPNNPQPHDPPEVVDIGPTTFHFDTGVDYVPDTTLTDDYRCFLADVGAAQAAMATGFIVTPGNRAIVHHAIIGLYDASSRDALVALDAETPDRAGWPCTGGLVPEATANVKQIGSLGSWVPGVSAVAFPAGTGNPIAAGALAVIQVHYNLLGGSDPDRTTVAIATASDTVAPTLIPLGGIGLIRHDLTIPIDDAAAVNTQSATVTQWRALRGGKPFPSGHGYAMGIGGHMHLVGHRITVTRTNASGDQILLDIPAWTFHWQGQYQFAQPIEIDNTDTLTIRCEYDNSNTNRLAQGLQPNTSVGWGEGTTDEMCLASIQIVDHLP